MQQELNKIQTQIRAQDKEDQNTIDEPFALDYPAPIAAPAYHGIAGEFVHLISPHSEADPAALLLSFLAASGNLMGSRPHFTVESDRHAMRLFPLLVGETAKGRKGVSWNHVRRFCKIADQNWRDRIVSGMSSGEGLILAVSDQDEDEKATDDPDAPKKSWRAIRDQQTQNKKRKRLLVIESEFASILKRIERKGNTLSPLIRQAWDSGNLNVLTVKAQRKGDNKATAAHISIIGHITKEELLRYLQETETANGFANRFLFVCVRRSKTLPFGGDIPQPEWAHLQKKYKDIITWCQSAGQVQWHDRTKPLWAEIYPDLSAGKPGLVGAVTSRAEAYVTRLAATYTLLDKKIFIEPEHLEAALAVWEYCEASTQYIFQDKMGNPMAEKIFDGLRQQPDGLSRTEISSDLFNRNKSKQEIDEALDLLAAYNRAKMTEERTSPSGHTSEIWKLV
ncbi:MAG: DUF3987 domain-containing protein [Candidatus Marinimicrobia bacterium]|nr:DUF3987 domain-containing protein [Candidatus Neomarinimicrobiota bacterium]